MKNHKALYSISIFLTLLLCCSCPIGCHSDAPRGRPPASEVFSGIPIDSEMAFTSLEGRVEVIWDEWGVPHIYGIDGDPGDAMFLLAAGELEIYVTDPDTGVEISLTTMGPFQYVREMSLLTPRSSPLA